MFVITDCKGVYSNRIIVSSQRDQYRQLMTGFKRNSESRFCLPATGELKTRRTAEYF